MKIHDTTCTVTVYRLAINWCSLFC